MRICLRFHLFLILSLCYFGPALSSEEGATQSILFLDTQTVDTDELNLDEGNSYMVGGALSSDVSSRPFSLFSPRSFSLFAPEISEWENMVGGKLVYSNTLRNGGSYDLFSSVMWDSYTGAEPLSFNFDHQNKDDECGYEAPSLGPVIGNMNNFLGDVLNNLGGLVECRPETINGVIARNDSCCRSLEEDRTDRAKERSEEILSEMISDVQIPYARNQFEEALSEFTNIASEMAELADAASGEGGLPDSQLTLLTLRDNNFSCVESDLEGLIEKLSSENDHCSGEMFTNFVNEALEDANERCQRGGECGAEDIGLLSDVVSLSYGSDREVLSLVREFSNENITDAEFRSRLHEQLNQRIHHVFDISIDMPNRGPFAFDETFSEVIESSIFGSRRAAQVRSRGQFMERMEQDRQMIFHPFLHALATYELAYEQGRIKEMDSREKEVLEEFLEVSSLNPNFTHLLEESRDPDLEGDVVERFSRLRENFFNREAPAGMTQAQWDQHIDDFRELSLNLSRYYAEGGADSLAEQQRETDNPIFQAAINSLERALETSAVDHAQELMNRCQRAVESFSNACILASEQEQVDITSLLGPMAVFASKNGDYNGVELGLMINGLMSHQCKDRLINSMGVAYDRDAASDMTSIDEARGRGDFTSHLPVNFTRDSGDRDGSRFGRLANRLESTADTYGQRKNAALTGNNFQSSGQLSGPLSNISDDSYASTGRLNVSGEGSFSGGVRDGFHISTPNRGRNSNAGREVFETTLNQAVPAPRVTNPSREFERVPTARERELENKIARLERGHNRASSQREGEVSSELAGLRAELERLRFENERLAIENDIERERESISSLNRRLQDGEVDQGSGSVQSETTANVTNGKAPISSRYGGSAIGESVVGSGGQTGAVRSSAPATSTGPQAGGAGGQVLNTASSQSGQPGQSAGMVRSTAQGVTVSAGTGIALSSVTQVPSGILDLDHSENSFQSVHDAASYALIHQRDSFIYRGILYESEGGDFHPVAVVEDGLARDSQDIDSIIAELLASSDLEVEEVADLETGEDKDSTSRRVPASHPELEDFLDTTVLDNSF